ncbi:hypothetical protein [Cerasicoccus arenae]|uniref:Uncharacterized protein n=1 Tax=Cerasicoccus arenae TaxID=424488 RepID=A0A8J3DJN9_9BACT|nr:hypothetical protein [Cerasicoccus arenae]MBK1857334.1 hypothetical protein [Cerasicoccus arenae]GHC08825.1 hypothetical protein GCM10007047_27550 [Cerasicoccus arenae]
MIRFLQRTLLVSSLLAGCLLHAKVETEARFDLRVIAPDFEGKWAEIEVETEKPTAPIQTYTAPVQEEVVVYNDLTSTEAAMLRSNNQKEFVGPEFAASTIYPSGQAVVFGVTENKAADIVILDDGLDQGFRVGMLCDVIRGDTVIGAIILVAVEADRSAGLIVNLQPGRKIVFGDLARIKTVQFS